MKQALPRKGGVKLNKEDVVLLAFLSSCLLFTNSLIVFVDNRLKERAERKKREVEQRREKWKRTVKRRNR
jgi:cytidylate kinase